MNLKMVDICATSVIAALQSNQMPVVMCENHVNKMKHQPNHICFTVKFSRNCFHTSAG